MFRHGIHTTGNTYWYIGKNSRLVPDLRNLSYCDRLKRYGLNTLEDRRKRGALIETYQIITGKGNIRRDRFFNG